MDNSLAAALSDLYGLAAAEVRRVQAGTVTDNYVVADSTGDRWFAKVYRHPETFPRERAAIELAEFARAGGVPVPARRRTADGALIGEGHGLALSLWTYVADAETAEGGLSGESWARVGTVLGRLHRRLAGHPAAAPLPKPASGVCDVNRARVRFDRLIAEYRRRRTGDTYQAWALEAALERRALLPRVEDILAGLPDLTTQVLHGDLAAPNLLLRGNEVAAVIDFQPPARGYVSWEISRIGCDPRRVLRGDEWVTGLPALLRAYQQENPATTTDDLTSVVAVGCAYTVASTYPLAEPLKSARALDPALEAYGRARHDAALRLLTRLDDLPDLPPSTVG